MWEMNKMKKFVLGEKVVPSKIVSLIVRLIVILFLLPLVYIFIYRPIDYYLCPGFINMRLGKPFSSPIVTTVKDSLSLGMTKDEVVSILDDIGRVEMRYIPGLSGGWNYQMDLHICTDPFNRIAIFTKYSDTGELIWVKFLDD